MTAFLFDFDGLLIDSETAGLLSWTELYAEYAQVLDRDRWVHEVANGRGPVMPVAELEALVATSIDWTTVEARRLARRNELIKARPGVLRLLADARARGIPCAIVSNAPGWWIDEQLAHTQIPVDFFDAVVAKEEGRAKKPAPDSYLAALDALRVRPADAVAFEDSPLGVTAAKAAGILCVAVPNEVTGGLSFAAADWVLGSLADVTVDELLRFHGSRTRRPVTSPRRSRSSASFAASSE